MPYLKNSRIIWTSLIMLLIPLYLFLLWLYACSQVSGYPDTRIFYNDHLPSFFQARYAPGIVSLLFSGAALTLSLSSISRQQSGRKLLPVLIAVIAGFLVLINLWSMM